MYLRIVAAGPVRRHGVEALASARIDGRARTGCRHPAGLGPDVRRTEVRRTISAADWYAQNWLPMPYPATRWTSTDAGGSSPRAAPSSATAGRPPAVRSTRSRACSCSRRRGSSPTAPAPPARAAARVHQGARSRCRRWCAETARKVTRGRRRTTTSGRCKLQDWFAVEGGFTYDTQVQVGQRIRRRSPAS